MNPEEIAYSAGLYEGEGTVAYLAPQNAVEIRIKMTDLKPLSRMEAIWGGRVRPVIDVSAKAHWKPQFGWHLTNINEVREFFRLVRPWLSPRRIVQAEEKLSHRREPGRQVITERDPEGRIRAVSWTHTDPKATCVPPDKPSHTGYHAHLRRDEICCADCRAAYNLYMREYRITRQARNS